MDASIKIYLGIALMIVMMGMGLSLTKADFKRVVLYPKAVFIGLFNQIILLPIMAFLLITWFEIRPALAVGMMILAASPGGPTSNLITHLSKGDTALSVTLTAFSSLITLITIPLILEWSLAYYWSDQIPVVLKRMDVFKELVIVTLIPVVIGISIKHYRPKFADKMNKPVKVASALILIIVIVGIIIKEIDKIVPYFYEVGLSTLSLNILALTVGFLTATFFGLPKSQRISISIESGIQNGTLSIAIAIGILNNTDFAIPAVIYSLIMFLSAFILIVFFNATHNRSIE